MKYLLLLFLLSWSTSLLAEREVCGERANARAALEQGFNVRFCFGTEELRYGLQVALEESGIPHIVHENGDIGYRSEDRGQVRQLREKLEKAYLLEQRGN